MNEATALKLCFADKDPRGFEYLFVKYRKEAFYHAMGFLGNQEDAIEACQDAFAKSFKAMPHTQELDNFYPWFYVILKNHCLNIINKRRIADKYKEHEKYQYQVNSPSNDPESSYSPYSILIHNEEQKLVWEIIRSLGPEFKEILVMKHIEGRDYREIAQLLNILRGTVMSRLYNARKAFRAKYLLKEDKV